MLCCWKVLFVQLKTLCAVGCAVGKSLQPAPLLSFTRFCAVSAVTFGNLGFIFLKYEEKDNEQHK